MQPGWDLSRLILGELDGAPAQLIEGGSVQQEQVLILEDSLEDGDRIEQLLARALELG